MSEDLVSGGSRGLIALVVEDLGKARRASGSSRPAVQYSAYWENGALGTVVKVCEDKPDLTLRVSAEDAHLMSDGQLAPSVAFMQGRLKAQGDNALLLKVLAWSATPSFRQKIGDLKAQK
ncbi:MAG: SCP2 sterol-binding domain-containing protein [Acidimicrobiales bacterium]